MREAVYIVFALNEKETMILSNVLRLFLGICRIPTCVPGEIVVDAYSYSSYEHPLLKVCG